MANWSPWHGCHKYSAGCLNCYMYRHDVQHDGTPSVVRKLKTFDLPVRRNRQGAYKLQCEPGDLVYTCFTSDFFVEDADAWRPAAWQMIRERNDLTFFIITKRIVRLSDCLPPDWGDGYPNVMITCTCENQKAVDTRLPVLLRAPLHYRGVTCEPLLGPIDFHGMLDPHKLHNLSVGGESGPEARPCRYEWILDIRQQCAGAGIPFHFRQTGARFVKDGRLYLIPRPQQARQAHKANIDL